MEGRFSTGVTLLFALWWRGAVSVALAGLVAVAAMHAVSHPLDINTRRRTTT